MRKWLSEHFDHDENKHAQLAHTLKTYLDCRGDHDKAAAALHIHRSTLRYRLMLIRELATDPTSLTSTPDQPAPRHNGPRFLNPR